MKTLRTMAGLLVVVLMASVMCVKHARAEGREDFEKLQKDVDELRKLLDQRKPGVGQGPVGKVDELTEGKYEYGPNAPVITRTGKLTLGGLVQVWYYHIANDSESWSDHQAFRTFTPFASNEARDNDSFRVRRAELKFTMDITENVTGVVMIDPAREATSFPSLPATQSSVTSGDGVAFFADSSAASLNAVRNGTGNSNRLLQDAYINVHDILPHHDVTSGQFKRRLGEEGTRDSSQLDFVERAMITQLADLRDMGIQVHGTWWDDRFQYWLGAFDGAGSAFQQRQNRSNDNDERDLVATFLVRPLWKQETWGSLEIGASILYGKGGEAGGHFSGTHPINGLNMNKTNHMMQYAWLAYHPGGPVKGWWIRGEYGMYRDRFFTGVANVGGTDTVGGNASASNVNPAPFTVHGWYGSTGYKLSDSVWADELKNGGMIEKILHDMEFTFRYETMENLFYTAIVPVNRRRQLDDFSTTVYTAGINYYVKGNNVKIQFNYNIVDEENDGVDQNQTFGGTSFRRFVREVSNNNFVINFQVSW